MSGANSLRADDSPAGPDTDLSDALAEWEAAIKALHALPHDAALPVRVSVLKRVERTQLEVAQQARALIRGSFIDR